MELYFFSFANDLIKALTNRVVPAIEGEHLQILEVFDAGELVALHCGKRSNNNEIEFEKPEGEVETFGVTEVAALLESVAKMKHIRDSGMNFDSRMR